MLAVLNEACAAREDRDPLRYSLMVGFLVGLMSTRSPWGLRYRHGSLMDAVLAAHDRNPEEARTWVRAESITAWEEQGESADTDPRGLLLRWLVERLAAGHRFSCPTFIGKLVETQDERRNREAQERAYYERQEASTHREQNFGKRIADRDGEGIRVPMSYSLNRALVLGSHEEDHSVEGDHET